MIRFLILSLLIFTLTSCSTTQKTYSTGVIDLGVVVSDIDKSLEFYQDVIGFQKVSQFTGKDKVVGDAGLLNYESVNVHVLSLNGDEQDTKLKLMQTKSKSVAQDQTYIGSTLGVSYITLFVNDLTPILENLKKHNVKVMAKGPVDLAVVGFAPNYLACVRDPDGSIIEFVGPMKTVEK